MARVAVRADRAFDGRESTPGGALVLCADGKIVGVQPAAAPVPDGWPVADYPGGTVLPGMTDCHVHLCRDSPVGALDRLPGYSDDELDQVIETALRAQLAAGVTTVRDLGGRQWAVRGQAAWHPRLGHRRRSSHRDHRPYSGTSRLPGGPAAMAFAHRVSIAGRAGVDHRGVVA